MLLVADVVEKRRRQPGPAADKLEGLDLLKANRSEIPAVTHVDYSARVQTVHAETNPRFHALLEAFKGRTGCSVVVNTSFNVRGEPIVCTPEDAFHCFMGTEMDCLAIGDCFLEKEDQDETLKSVFSRLVSKASESHCIYVAGSRAIGSNRSPFVLRPGRNNTMTSHSNNKWNPNVRHRRHS